MKFLADCRGVISVWEGALVMLVFCLGGFIATIGLGTLMDVLVDESVDMMIAFNVPESWNTLPQIMWLVTDLHLLLIMIPILGILLFVVSVVHKTRYDQYRDSYMVTEDEEMLMEEY